MRIILVCIINTPSSLQQLNKTHAVVAIDSHRFHHDGAECETFSRFDVRGAPAPVLLDCPARFLFAFPTKSGVEDETPRQPPSAESWLRASCESSKPLTPPLTLTRLLAFAPLGRMVTCSATCIDA